MDLKMEKPEGKREIILKAAAEVFCTRGYSSAKMEEIAVAAGVGKGTIYEYFDSKLQLFQELMMESWNIYSDLIGMEDIMSLPFEELLRWSIQAHIDISRKHRRLIRIVFWDMEHLDRELKDWVLETKKMKEAQMLELIEAAIARGEIKPVDSKMVYLLLTGLISSIWGFTAIDGWKMDSGQLAAEMTETIMHGLKNN